MNHVIQTKRVVTTASGAEFDSPGAFARHKYQAFIGKARTTIKIKRADEPLKQSAHSEKREA